MKILVYGVGALGSLMIHYLLKAGNDVTAVARSTYEELRRNGLVIRHELQNKTTIDSLNVVREADLQQRYDIVFSVLQGQQQNALLDTFAELNTSLIVLVGNNVETARQKHEILTHTKIRKNVLFGFQNSAGHREAGKTVSAHLPVTELVVGRLHQAVSDREKFMLQNAFHTSGYLVTFYDDMYAYYLCHIAEIMPFAYLCYRLEYDLKHASAEDMQEIMQASHEAFVYLKSIGIKMVPPNEDDYYADGLKSRAMYLLYRVIAKTKLGKLMVSDHCQNGIKEMKYLDQYFHQFRNRKKGSAMPIWDKIRKEAEF